MLRQSNQSRGRRALAAAVAFITVGSLLPAPMLAQEVVRSAPDALATAPDIEVRDGQLMLSLEDAIVTALRRNLGLQVQRFRRAGAYEFIRANKGIFDLNLGFATGLAEETQPSVSALEGADVRQTEGSNYDLQLDQLLSTGGVVGALTISSPVDRFTPALERACISQVTRGAAEVSRTLGFNPGGDTRPSQ